MVSFLQGFHSSCQHCRMCLCRSKAAVSGLRRNSQWKYKHRWFLLSRTNSGSRSFAWVLALQNKYVKFHIQDHCGHSCNHPTCIFHCLQGKGHEHSFQYALIINYSTFPHVELWRTKFPIAFFQKGRCSYATSKCWRFPHFTFYYVPVRGNRYLILICMIYKTHCSYCLLLCATRKKLCSFYLTSLFQQRKLCSISLHDCEG
jgi:hypothetical protein